MDPAQLRYAPTHEWVDIQGDTATVGISKFAVDQLTDLLTIELPSVGTHVVAGKSFGEVESVKSVNDVYAPISGEVVAVNEPLASNVQLLSEDPYAKGWLVKIKVADPAEADKLLDYAAYEKKIAEDEH
ncbi:MAG: glycine cleavage system protein GcvH [Paludisphaera borealis]|uniref:glycine cleavage system protein GcvH n=1 Tax=Paludisphaera borealis TaxID=1387353 RepID=UPI00284E662A|nr:glycine cleavage system protein GcvH [Paludisphaera borealis]MDR3617790.1 glycine cleavage system protein GcvH [Paludisphaera borealis]